MTIRRKYGTPALGRGLDALLDTSEVNTGGSSNIGEVDVMLIKPNPDQPRRNSMRKACANWPTASRR